MICCDKEHVIFHRTVALTSSSGRPVFDLMLLWICCRAKGSTGAMHDNLVSIKMASEQTQPRPSVVTLGARNARFLPCLCVGTKRNVRHGE
ncbi:hypothetical protein L210DRAFT_3552414 [Boletus edulis BED1]|uniref:Uncharacterized protein n=1 Tax=Boletus edulis BED1 TaxID=1328754 RepID=A0AAD4GBM1_BOLED|nr:hypothetical protein L210DRAFT_3552414 [Boletus edulis BED1]